MHYVVVTLKTPESYTQFTRILRIKIYISIIYDDERLIFRNSYIQEA